MLIRIALCAGVGYTVDDQFLAIAECIVCDGAYISADPDALQDSAVGKGIVFNEQQAVGQNHIQQSGTAAECACGQGSHAFRQVEGCQIGASRKEFTVFHRIIAVTEAGIPACGQCNGRQMGAVLEYLIAQTLHRRGNHDGFQTTASGEGVMSQFLQGGGQENR